MWPLILPLLFFVFWPLFGGQTFFANGISYSDLWLFNYPLKDWYRGLLLEGQLPFWTSLLGNGYPVFAEGQIGALYPFNLFLFRFFPTALAFNLNLFLHFFLAFIFTYWFGRYSLKLSQASSFLAGLSFAFSGYFWIHIQYLNVLLVISYLPLVFLCIEKLVSSGRFLWMFVLGSTYALQILAGHLEFFLYSFLLSIVFFILILFIFPEKKQKAINSILLFGTAVFLAVGITLVQTIPTYELTKESNRSGGFDVEYASSTIWPLKTLSFFVSPYFFDNFQREENYHPLKENFTNPNALYGYLGFLPLVLAIFAILFFRKRMVVVFSLLMFLAFIYGQGRSTQFFEILWQTIPGLNMLRFPVKILFFIEFCLSILAGFGAEKVMERVKKVKLVGDLRVLRVMGVGLVLVVFADLYFNNVLRFAKMVEADWWLKRPPAAEFLQEKLGDRNYRFYTQSTNNLADPGQDFTMHKEFQNILPVNFNLIYRLPSNREYFTLFLNRQKILENQRSSFDAEKGELVMTDRFRQALNLQSVRYLVMDLPIYDPDFVLVEEYPFSKEAGHSIFFADGKTQIVPSKGVYVYENKKAYPRVLWVPSFVKSEVEGASAFVETSADKSEGKEEEVLGEVLDGDFDPEKEVILDGPLDKLDKLDQLDSNNLAKGKVEIQKDMGNEITIRVESEREGYLALADTYYPGWKAEVDGRETKIYRANYNFRAVLVPAGEHEVRFSFLPTFWQIIFPISLAFFALTLFGTLFAWRFRK